MNVGLHIPGEAFELPLDSKQIMVWSAVKQLHDNGKCYASYDHLSTWLGIPKRTIVRVFSSLIEAGFITREGRYLIPHTSPVSAKMAPPQCQNSVVESAKMAPVECQSGTTKVPEWHLESAKMATPSELEANKKINKKSNKKTYVSASGLFGDEPAPAKKTRQPQPVDPIFDALVKCCGLDPKLNSGMAAKAAHQYLKLGYTAEHVEATARLWTFNNGTMPSVGFITSRIAQGKAACDGKPLAVPVAVSGPSTRFGATHKDKKDWL